MTAARGEAAVRDRLADIVEWGETLAGLVAGFDRDRFVADVRTRLAAVKCIEAIGEAAGQLLRLDPAIEARFPDLDARRAYEARNRLSHGYFSIDYAIVWDTAVLAVPRLVAAARAALG